MGSSSSKIREFRTTQQSALAGYSSSQIQNGPKSP